MKKIIADEKLIPNFDKKWSSSLRCYCADRNTARPAGYQKPHLYGRVGLCIIGLLPECRGEPDEF